MTKSKKILLIDDDLFVREMIRSILTSRGYLVETADNGREGIQTFQSEESIDLILTDINMPIIDGMGVVKKIREIDASIPIMMLTVNNEIRTALEAIRLGADDYIIKGFSISETLPLSIAKIFQLYDLKMENKKLIQELSQKNDELKRLALYDSLTGIPNRRYFDISIREEWWGSLKSRNKLSLLLIDIDYFKQLNDTYGHQFGDDVLKTISGILRQASESSKHFFARFGGDEFAVMLKDTNQQEVSALAEELLTCIRKKIFITPEGKELQVTISIGGTILSPELVDDDHNILLTQADKALYKVKEAGRNDKFIEKFAVN